MMNEKEDEVYSMKLHVSSIKDNTSGEFQEKGPTNNKKQLNSVGQKQKDQSVREDTVNREQKPDKSKDSKIPILLIGTSNIKLIDPQRWPQYSTKEHQAFTLEEAIEVIEGYKTEPGTFHPNVTIFHSLTNDIKTLEADECVRQISALTNKTIEVFPNTKIIISLATPRNDNEMWNIRGELANAMLKQEFRENDKIVVCDNSNLSVNGKTES